MADDTILMHKTSNIQPHGAFRSLGFDRCAGKLGDHVPYGSRLVGRWIQHWQIPRRATGLLCNTLTGSRSQSC